MPTIDKIESDIKTLKIQGATNVALAVLEALTNTLADNPTISIGELKAIGARLAYARLTEPLAQNALRYIFSNGDISTNIEQYRTFIDAAKQSIPVNGEHLLVDGGVYLTLCHSSTTISLFKQARADGAYFSLYVAETRPLYQGRITATELLTLGFDDVTMIIDDVAVSLLEGRKGKIDAVFIGADLLSDSGFVNKVGTLAVTAAAHRKQIPVYVLATLLKYDPRPFDQSIIEHRRSEEIWKDAPKNLTLYNPAFDYVPYSQIINIVCERGILKGDKIKEAVQKTYPFVLN